MTSGEDPDDAIRNAAHTPISAGSSADDDQKGTSTIGTLGGPQQMLIAHSPSGCGKCAVSQTEGLAQTPAFGRVAACQNRVKSSANLPRFFPTKVKNRPARGYSTSSIVVRAIAVAVSTRNAVAIGRDTTLRHRQLLQRVTASSALRHELN
jgi:hypothetical protein